MPPYRVIFARRGAKFEVVINARSPEVATGAGLQTLSKHVGLAQVAQWTHVTTRPDTISLDSTPPTAS